MQPKTQGLFSHPIMLFFKTTATKDYTADLEPKRFMPEKD